MILLDLSHTSHTRARTGVQRVCRALHRSLGTGATPITHDPYREAWRPLQNWEHANLASIAPAPKRGAQWPFAKRLAGRAARWLGSSPAALPPADALVVPEIFSPHSATAFPPLFAHVKGPRVALFHDAIALKFPELSPTKTVARFPAYLRELLVFDGIAAVSEYSRQSLLDYWRWLGVTNTPPVVTIPLGLEMPAAARAAAPQNPVPVVLCVGSIEGRKNHAALLDACELLWNRGGQFELHLIGLAHAQTGRAALEKVRALQARGRSLRYDGPQDDAALEAAYHRCDFTVYPSLCEGFGLPVLESLTHGKPCICSSQGALGESAAGGGCLTLASPDATSIADAMAQLLDAPERRDALRHEASSRVYRTWDDYAGELKNWIQTLRRT